MAWGVIAYYSKLPMVRIQSTVTILQYMKDVLWPVMPMAFLRIERGGQCPLPTGKRPTTYCKHQPTQYKERCHPSGIVVSDADCGAVGSGFESRRVCQLRSRNRHLTEGQNYVSTVNSLLVALYSDVNITLTLATICGRDSLVVKVTDSWLACHQVPLKTCRVEQTVYICPTSRGSSQPPDKLLKVITFQTFEKEGLNQA
ncbi:hypothetical protein TNCV_1152931 [Trichonephila clavipes]|nr:hypothetical protein TNCV_1152931 [Trichonephila clavipes]